MKKHTFILPIFLCALWAVPFCSFGQPFRVNIRLISVQQTGAPFIHNIPFYGQYLENRPTSWKTQHMRLRRNGQDMVPGPDNFGCVHDGAYSMGQLIGTNQLQSYTHSGGFPLNDYIHLWWENHGWWNDDGDVCTSQGPGQHWVGIAWKGWRDRRIASFAPNADQVYPYEFQISGHASDGTAVSHPYHYNYEISYHVDAVANALTYKALDGITPKSLVCPGEQYIIELPYINGFSNGLFRWEELVGNTWVFSQWGGNQITVTAQSPPRQFRARLWSTSYSLGDNNNDPSKWRSTETNPITVLPNKPTGIDFVSGYCEGFPSQLVVRSLANATLGGNYRLTLKKISGPVLFNGTITYNGQFPFHEFTNIPPGSYELKVTAVNQINGISIGDCTAVFPVDVPEYPLPEFSATPGNALCFGGNGSIFVNINDYWSGPTPYTVQLLDNGNNLLEENLSYSGTTSFTPLAGTYQIKVLNVLGCESGLQSVVVGEPATLPTATITIESTITTPGGQTYDTGCADEGEIGVTPSGGIGNGSSPQFYNIKVYDTDTGNLFAELDNAEGGVQHILKCSAGNNHLEITDANGCTNDISTLTVFINVPPVSELVINPINTATPSSSCVNDGVIDLTGNSITGGLPPYRVYLNNMLVFNTDTETIISIDTLTGGRHQIKVIDALDCIKKHEVDLSVNGLNIVTEASPLSCFGSNDGTIQVEALGGNISCTMNCDYKISLNNGPFESFPTGLNGILLENLPAGDHSIRVEDGDGCQVVETVTVVEPEELVITDITFIPARCRDDDILVWIHHKGGYPDNQRRILIDGTTNMYWPNSSPIPVLGITPGLHDFVIFDESNCASETYSIDIFNPPAVELSVDATYPTSCPGSDDGSVDLSFSGGYGAPFNIELDCSEVPEVLNGINSNSLTINNLRAGSHCLRISDSRGCSKEINFVIGEPAPIQVNISGTTAPSNCSDNNGTITVSASQGTPPYEYSLDGLGFSTDNVLQEAGTQNMVYVRDSKGCVDSTIVSLPPFNSPLSLSTPQVIQDDYSGCGQSRGEAQFVVSGYAPPLTILPIDCNSSSYPLVEPVPNATISTSDTTIQLQNLAVGTYCYVVYDGTGCFQVLPAITIDEPTPLTLTVITKTAESCYGESNDGTITLQASGGMPPYTFSSSNGNISSSNQVTITNLNSGEHVFTVVDQLGCSDGVEEIIAANTSLSATSNLNNAQGCPGLDFRMDIEVLGVGGTPPYTINWPDGSTGSTKTELPAGNYLTTITDALGCTKIYGAYVPSPTPVVLSIDQTTDVICAGEMNGGVSLSAQAGFGNYTYSLDNVNFQPSANFGSLPPGNYVAYVKDAAGCTDAAPFEILLLNNLSATYDSTDITCYQAADGSITANASGGNGLVSYSLNGGPFQANNTFGNLNPGTYELTIQDQDNCQVTFSNITLSEPTELLANSNLIQHASCSQANGMAEVVVSGGIPPYSYEWDNNPSLNAAQLNNAFSGMHSVIVTDYNGCQKAASIQIDDLSPPSIVDLITVNAACGASNGSVQAILTDGTMPFSYEWNGNPSLNTDNLSNLPPGNYTLVVTDARGCTATANTTIFAEPILSITEVTNISEACGQMDGSAQVLFNGGTPPYTYTWDHDPSLNAPNLDNVTAGTYQITITDNRGCTETTVVNIAETPPLSHDNTLVVPEACSQQDGALEVFVSGGTPPYAYLWNNDPFYNSSQLSNAAAGSHTLVVTDSRNCELPLYLYIPEAIGPAILEALTVEEACHQANGQAEVVVSGGTAPLSYEWDGNPLLNSPQLTNASAGNHNVVVTDARSCAVAMQVTIGFAEGPSATVAEAIPEACDQLNGSISLGVSGGTSPLIYEWNTFVGFPPGPEASGLSAGDYSITITDDRGCTEIVEVSLPEIAPPNFSATTTLDEACGQGDGAITFNPLGGTPPFSFEWSHDPNLNSPNADNLTAGAYFVTLVDALGCTTTNWATLNNLPAPLLSIAQNETAHCDQPDGLISVSATSFSENTDFSFSWSHNPAASGPTQNDLVPGFYEITVTDNRGCNNVTSATVDNEAGVQLHEGTITASSCALNNGSASVIPTGGTPPYTYSWSFDPAFNSAFAADLPAGVYTATVTDFHGCTDEVNLTVGGNQGPEISLIDSSNSICSDGTGSITVQVDQGTPPYQYTWSQNANSNGPIAQNLLAGIYSLSVTDANGCLEVFSHSIEFIPAPSLDILSQNEIWCSLDNGGAINLQAASGTPPYSFAWNHDPGWTASAAADLLPGDYSITLTDANGCSDVVNTTLQFIPGPTATVGLQSDACLGQENGSITIVTAGGTGAIQFQWSHNPSLNSPFAQNLDVGNYSVTVSDANNCEEVVETVIAEVFPPTLTLVFAEESFCEIPTGQLIVEATGGQAPYSFSWSHNPGLNSPIANNLFGGTSYQVTVSDANDCEDVQTFEVPAPVQPEALVADFSNSTCGEDNGSISITVSSGTGPFSYQWNHDPSINSPELNDLPADLYSVTITDQNLCQVVVDQAIVSESGPEVTSATVTDVFCDPNATGAIQLTVERGSSPLSYQWDHNTALNSSFANDLLAGNYTVTIIDANNCSLEQSYLIEFNAAPIAEIAVINNACVDDANGSVTIATPGSQEGLEFHWSHDPGLHEATAEGLASGNYAVTITNPAGCEIILEANVEENSIPELSLVANTPANCGQADGSLEVEVLDGTGNYTYSWSHNESLNSALAIALPGGSYTVSVQDANQCIAELQMEVEENQVMLSVESFEEETCASSNGNISLQTTGGTLPYTYAWSHNVQATGAIQSNLSSQQYTITVTDNEGCTATVSQFIQSVSPPVISSTTTPSSCSNNDGSLQINVNGGMPPYTFSWGHDTQETSADLQNLVAGIYEVIVEDAAGCIQNLAIAIPSADGPVLDLVQVEADYCDQSVGLAEVSVTGGADPYAYAWANVNEPGTIISTQSQATQLVSGSYGISVTDAAGCQSVLLVEVEEVPAMELTIQSMAPDCFGADNGTASVEVTTGGTPPFSYSWNDPQQQNTASATNLASGDYTVLVVDANGCMAQKSLSLSAPPALSASLNFTAPSCNTPDNGTASVIVSGGTGSYTYTWNDPQQQNTATATGLTPGTYEVTITDVNNCSLVASTTLPDVANLLVNIQINPPNCEQLNSGSATAEVLSGSGQYSYLWNDPAVQMTETASELPAGTYSVTVNDLQSGCTEIGTVTIPEVSEITMTAQINDPSCFEGNNGSIELMVTGGSGQLNYQWDGTNNQQSETAQGLNAGTYTVTVEDTETGCILEESFTLTAPETLVISLENLVQPGCNGVEDGSITVNVNGGTGNYTYTWAGFANTSTASQENLPEGEYMLTVTDGNGCSIVETYSLNATDAITVTTTFTWPDCQTPNSGTATAQVSGGIAPFAYQWSDESGQQGQTAFNLNPGTYQVTVSDNNGCNQIQSVEIPDAGTLSLSTNIIAAPTCSGDQTGTAMIEVQGGSGDYSYQWNDANLQTTATANQLAAGHSFTVVVEDLQTGCTEVTTLQIPEIPALAIVVNEIIQPTCNGATNGSIALEVDGGSGAYFFTWDDTALQTSSTATQLTEGTYSVTVQDSDGCAASASFDIEALSSINASIGNLQSPSCSEVQDGQASVVIENDPGNIQFQWNDPLAQTTATATGLAAGVYEITVTDPDNCFVVLEVIIPATEALELNVMTQVEPNCNGDNNGVIALSSTGGNGPYVYHWSHDASLSGSVAPNLNAGTYLVTLTDANNCQTHLSVELGEPNPLQLATLQNTPPGCFGANDGSISVAGSGGSGILDYQWNDPAFQTTANAAGLTAGSYTVVITDENNCSLSTTFVLEDPDQIEILANQIVEPSCSGFNDGSISIQAGGGTGELNYVWDDPLGQNTSTASSLSSGFYTVSVSDNNGCTQSLTIELIDLEALTLTANLVSPLCYNTSDGSIQVEVSGGTGAYDFLWNNGQTSPLLIELMDGNYSITITDTNGCELQEDFELFSNAIPISLDDSQFLTPSCAGAADGQIEVSIGGGSSVFTYLWSDGSTTPGLEGIGTGFYEVEVTDSEGCTEIFSFELADGLPFEIELGKQDTAICDGEILFYDFEDLTADFQWSSSNGFSSTDPMVLLEEAGMYYLNAENTAGCQATDSIALHISSEPFQAFFITPTDIVAGDTAVVVEASWPIPANLNWHYNRDSIQYIGSDLNQHWFAFPYPGEFELTLEAASGGCEDWLTKRIRVYPDSTFIPEPQQSAQTEIIRFELAPNPNDGQFQVWVELAEAKDISLNIYSMEGLAQERWIGKGASTYSPDFNLNLVPGVYVLILQTPLQRKSIVFTVMEL